MANQSINNNRYLALCCWLLGVMAVVLQFVIQLSSGAMLDGLVDSFHLNGLHAGLLAGAYYPIYCALQAPAGLLVNRYGAQKILMTGLLLAGWATMCFAFAPNYWVALFGRFLSGIGLSCCFVAMVGLTYQWFNANRFGMMIGFAETLIILSIVLMALILPAGVKHLGWQVVSEIMALSLVLLAAIIGLTMPIDDTEAQLSVFRGTLTEWAVAVGRYLKDPILIAHALYGGAMFGVITIFEGLWSQPFFIHAWGFSVEQASHANAWLLFGVACGAPFLGVLAQSRWRHSVMISLALLITISLWFLLQYGDTWSTWSLDTVLWMIGFAASAYVVSYAVAGERAASAHRTAVVGLNNMLVVVPALLIQPLVGWWLDHASGHGQAAHYLYALDHFDAWLLLMFFLSGWLLWANKVRPTP